MSGEKRLKTSVSAMMARFPTFLYRIFLGSVCEFRPKKIKIPSLKIYR